MKLSVVRGGGILGRSIRTQVASDDLSPEDARTLREKVEQAGLLTLSDALPESGRRPDELVYELAVEGDEGRNTVRLSESTLPEPVRSLIAWTDSVGRKEIV
jgi:hypothetical protein